jgi:hypothetical protein
MNDGSSARASSIATNAVTAKMLTASNVLVIIDNGVFPGIVIWCLVLAAF